MTQQPKLSPDDEFFSRLLVSFNSKNKHDLYIELANRFSLKDDKSLQKQIRDRLKRPLSKREKIMLDILQKAGQFHEASDPA